MEENGSLTLDSEGAAACAAVCTAPPAVFAKPPATLLSELKAPPRTPPTVEDSR